MLYTIGSLVLGALSTGISLWLKNRKQAQDAQAFAVLKEKYEQLQGQYNGLVEDANAQIAKLQDQNKDLLDALQNSGKPGVFADLLRARNTKTEPAK